MTTRAELGDVEVDGTIIGAILGAAGALAAAIATAFFALRKTVVEKYFDGIGERVRLLEDNLEREHEQAHELRSAILEVRAAFNESKLEVIELRRMNGLLELELEQTRLERDGFQAERDELAGKVERLEHRLDELITQTSEVFDQ